MKKNAPQNFTVSTIPPRPQCARGELWKQHEKGKNFPMILEVEVWQKVHIELVQGRKKMAQKNDLTNELVALFDLRKSQQRSQKILDQEAFEAQRDIRYLTLMFCDGIPDVCMKCTDSESIRWDSRSKNLLYEVDNTVQLLEAASKEIRVKMRPFLKDLVRKAKSFYSNS